MINVGFLKVALPALLSLFAFASHSEVVRQSVASSGQSYNAVYDSTTSLQWLSPVATKRLSIDVVLGGSGGWVQAGFRYATGLELLGLLEQYGIAVDPSHSYSQSPSAWVWSNQSEVDAAKAFVSDIGWTYENNQPSPGNPFGQRTVYGILGDQFLGDGQSPASSYFSWISATDNTAFANVPGSQWLHGDQDSLVGSFLVRNVSSVPEPGSLVLIFTGLALLNFWRPRRHSWTTYKAVQHPVQPSLMAMRAVHTFLENPNVFKVVNSTNLPNNLI